MGKVKVSIYKEKTMHTPINQQARFKIRYTVALAFNQVKYVQEFRTDQKVGVLIGFYISF